MTHPETSYWLEVHVRFAEGDKTAGERIVAHLLVWLIQILQHRQPNWDAHLIAESAEDALLNYWKAPKRFDVTRGVPLRYWLLLQARGYLANARRKEQNYQRHERVIGVQNQVFEQYTKVVSRMRLSDDYLLTEGEAQTSSPKEGISPTHRFTPKELVELELLSERAPQAAWAQLLSLKGWAESAQRQQIDREKERVRKKRLRLRKRLLKSKSKGKSGSDHG